MSRAERLQAFLERYEGVPVEWGVSDCTTSPATWVEEATGLSVPRLPYRSRDEAHALIEKAGGLVNVWDRALSEVGIYERYGRPDLGDVGVIDTRRFGPIGVIFGTNGVALWRREQGGWFPMAPRSYLKVWAVPE